jgi:hypothetical protein
MAIAIIVAILDLRLVTQTTSYSRHAFKKNA